MADRAPGRRSRGDWLSELPFRTIVLHRTVGLYRNLAETVFPERATPAGLAGARTRVLEALSSAASATRRRVSRVEGGWEAACGGVPPAEAPFFAGLPVPADPKAARWTEADFADVGRGAITAVVCAEDHLALFDRSGAPFARQWRTLETFASAVGAAAPFAESEEYGFLAANPDHVGNGLVLSCDVSLFGLCIDRTLDPALRALDRLGFSTPAVLPPAEGEESPIDAPGCRYRILSQHDSGEARDVVGRMDAVCREVARQEQNARLRLLARGSAELADFLARSLAAGANARLLSPGEAADIADAALFAEDLGLLRLDDARRAFLQTAPLALSDARLEAAAPKALAAAGGDRRAVRAAAFRGVFRGLPAKLRLG